MKKLHIKTYGCQMNVYDSERIAEVLAPLGFALSDCAEDADMVILNTCHIREKAAEKVFSELGRLRAHKMEKENGGGRMMIGVTGCVAQAQGEELAKRAPFVDLVFGPQTYHRLPEMVARAAREHNLVLDTDFPVDSKFDSLPSTRTVEGAAAFLAVQEGCDKFCTYCVVPYTRGAEYSRPVADVLAEAQALADAGAYELTLLGQNVNAYHGAYHGACHGRADEAESEWNLARLIRAVADIEGVKRIRYTTSYPAEMHDDLIAAHRDVDQLMPYLHLPVQSGSDRVLKAMNRQHTAAQYIAVVQKLRAARPDIAVSGDFIVGFPGESDEDFEDTLKLVEEVTFIQAYAFKYSARPGTPAALMDDQVGEAVKAERLARLQALLNAQTLAFNMACIGKPYAVLLDRVGKQPGQLIGRSPYMQPVVVEADATLMHTLQTVVITSATSTSLKGELVSDFIRDDKRACA
jgi:tRNA-2-methylthio-N6-dimethylallyladenosine synthase